MPLRKKTEFVFKSIPKGIKNSFTTYYYGTLMCKVWDKKAFKTYAQTGKTIKDVNRIVEKYMY